MNRFLILFLILILPALVSAQASQNLMYSSGRIYVVIAVILLIFVGFILYLVRIDKKVKKMEKEKPNS